MWKYIVLKVGNQEVPFIFPAQMVHAMVADAMVSYFVSDAMIASGNRLSEAAIAKLRNQLKVVSAGDILIRVASTSGKSDTLQIGSRPVDFALINSFPYTHGYVGDEEGK